MTTNKYNGCPGEWTQATDGSFRCIKNVPREMNIGFEAYILGGLALMLGAVLWIIGKVVSR